MIYSNRPTARWKNYKYLGVMVPNPAYICKTKSHSPDPLKERLNGIKVRKGLEGYPVITLPLNRHNGFEYTSLFNLLIIQHDMRSDISNT